MKNKSIISLFLIVVLISCKSEVQDNKCGLAENSRTINTVTKILFIGSSHTYVNDIPATIRLMAKSAGDSTYIHQETPGGYTFEWQSTREATLQGIHAGEWDFVILQGSGWQQAFPTFMADTAIYPYVQILIDEIHENNADTKIVFYMTHGYEDGVLTFDDEDWCGQDPLVCDYEGMQERIKDTYIEMSDMFEAELAPAGILWKILMTENSEIDLFGSDGIHASPEGSYLSACTIYSTIFRKSPVGSYVPDGVSSEEAQVIQNKVYEVLFHCNPDWREH